ncbi:MAG TPA: ABC transporter permease [Burkholderiaceae bacterium]|jgi:putative ABC transport system permease protein|nr:ABC transporter permease [Zoogloea sp.]HPH14402.1 ABC transporter permease [Burkholderiaceae bacterium]
MLLKLALRNMLRQKVRSGMTLAAIVFGVTGLILAGGFVQDIFIQLGEAIIHSQTGHIQIFKNDFLEKGTRSPERFVIEQPEKLAAEIRKHSEVDAVMSRLFFSGLLNNGKRDLAIIGEGVEPDREAKLGSFITIAAGRQLADSDHDGILLGQGVAKTLGLAPGDRVTLVLNAAGGAMNTLDFVVIGIFQSFSKDFDARAVRIPLNAAQEILQINGANVLVVALHKTEDTAAVHAKLLSELGGKLDVRTWNSLSDFYDKAVQLYDRQFGVLQLIILLMVLLSVANSVNMSVFERQGEFGTMQALGNRSLDIVKMVVLESTFLGLTGALLGVLLGITAALTISAIGIPMPPPPNANLGYTAYIRIVPFTLFTSGLVGIVATVLASILPAYKVTRMQVVDSLRQNI